MLAAEGKGAVIGVGGGGAKEEEVKGISQFQPTLCCRGVGGRLMPIKQ